MRWEGPTVEDLLEAQFHPGQIDGLQNLLENREGSSSVKSKFQKTASIKLKTGEISLSSMMGFKAGLEDAGER